MQFYDTTALTIMTSVEGTAVGWLPLPPRKKKAVMIHSTLTTVENNFWSNESGCNPEATELKTKVVRKVVASYPQIMDNIETRRNLHLTLTCWSPSTSVIPISHYRQVRSFVRVDDRIFLTPLVVIIHS